MKSAFDKISAGLKDAAAFQAGDTERGRIASLATPVDVRQVRAITKMSQPKFASAFNLSVTTVRDWEQGRRQPDKASATYLKLIAADPVAVQKLLTKIS